VQYFLGLFYAICVTNCNISYRQGRNLPQDACRTQKKTGGIFLPQVRGGLQDKAYEIRPFNYFTNKSYSGTGSVQDAFVVVFADRGEIEYIPVS